MPNARVPAAARGLPRARRPAAADAPGSAKPERRSGRGGKAAAARRDPEPTRPADPATLPPATSPGPLGAVMLACRAAVVEFGADDLAGREPSESVLSRLAAVRAAASLFPPLDAQQAAFALGVVADAIESLESETIGRNGEEPPAKVRAYVARAEAILCNVVAWLAAAHGADARAPEVAWHLVALGKA